MPNCCGAKCCSKLVNLKAFNNLLYSKFRGRAHVVPLMYHEMHVIEMSKFDPKSIRFYFVFNIRAVEKRL